MIHIGSDTDIGLNRNSSDTLGMNSYPIFPPGWILKEWNLILKFSSLMFNMKESDSIFRIKFDFQVHGKQKRRKFYEIVELRLSEKNKEL